MGSTNQAQPQFRRAADNAVWLHALTTGTAANDGNGCVIERLLERRRSPSKPKSWATVTQALNAYLSLATARVLAKNKSGLGPLIRAENPRFALSLNHMLQSMKNW